VLRKLGTILSPECKSYAKDIQDITGVDEYINLQYLRLIENLVCQRICEKVLDNKKEELLFEPITVEIPLIGNLIIIPVKNTNGKGGNMSFNFSFELLVTFRKHIQKIYNTNDCELISLLSENYSKQLTETYDNVLGEL
jgi:hypothetical protein